MGAQKSFETGRQTQAKTVLTSLLVSVNFPFIGGASEIGAVRKEKACAVADGVEWRQGFIVSHRFIVPHPPAQMVPSNTGAATPVVARATIPAWLGARRHPCSFLA